MAAKSVDEILEVIRALPLAARRELLERAAHDVEADTPKPGSVVQASSTDAARIDRMSGLPVYRGTIIGSLRREDIYQDVG